MTNSSRLLLILTGCYAVLLTLVAVVNGMGADRSWIGALNLYLPQVIWLIPGIPLVLFGLFLAPRLVILPLLCVAWVLGPIMGLSWSFSPRPALAKGDLLRVMTWNVKYGRHGKLSVLELIHEIDLVNPDLILLQDAGGVMNGPVGKFLHDWNLRGFGQYVIASRFPLSEATILPLPIPNETQECVRCEMRMGNRNLVLYNVHLQTPRQGLNAFKVVRKVPKYLPNAIGRLEENVEARLMQARTLAGYLSREKGPLLLAGDLNSPDPSLTCSLLRGRGLNDAFAAAGKGYGYTYGHFLLEKRLPQFNFSWMRLDHIMTTSDLRAIRCETGTKKASDHRPVITDLAWTHP